MDRPLGEKKFFAASLSAKITFPTAAAVFVSTNLMHTKEPSYSVLSER